MPLSRTECSHPKASSNSELVDKWGRPVTGARISLNPSSACNLNCIFCHREGINEPPSRTMTALEVERVVGVMTGFGVKKVKLTGGEPMIRHDIVEVVKRIHSLGIEDLSITTNGFRLTQLAFALKDAGLKRVNISLHSLSPETYRFITNSSRLNEVFMAVEKAIEADLVPVKLNMVVLNGVNNHEIEEMEEYAVKVGNGKEVVLQLIELVNGGAAADDQFYQKFHDDLKGIETVLEERAVKKSVRSLHHRCRYLLPNGAWVEVVRPMHNSAFCMADSRIRVTHDGYFKPCLLRRDNHVDFLSAMRRGCSDEELASLFKMAVERREPFFKPTILGKPMVDYPFRP